MWEIQIIFKNEGKALKSRPQVPSWLSISSNPGYMYLH